MTPEGFGNPWMANLTEIGLPEPIPWWPPAPGWYVVGGLLLLGLLWLCRRALERRRADAYRREALAQLDAIERLAFAPDTRRLVLRKLPVLLRQTALAAYPRPEVASLTGEAWLIFLDGSGGGSEFSSGPGRTMLDLIYSPKSPQLLDDCRTREVLAASRRWIRGHRRRS